MLGLNVRRSVGVLVYFSVPFLYNPAQGPLLLDTRTYANMLPLWMKLNATGGSRDTGADILEFMYSTSP